MLRKKRVSVHAPVTIGVCSFQHNAGVTCFCIALSNYLCSKKKYSVGYVEVNTTEEIISLKPRKMPPQKTSDFYLLRVHYYPSVTPKALSEIYAHNLQYYILDFGVASSYAQAEFYRCQQKYIICTPAPWKLNQLSLYFSELVQKNLQESITLLVNMGIQDQDGSMQRRLKQLFPARTIFLPTIQNPFQITSDKFEVYEKILKGV